VFRNPGLVRWRGDHKLRYLAAVGENLDKVRSVGVEATSCHEESSWKG
jgi:hypothetical protein